MKNKLYIIFILFTSICFSQKETYKKIVFEEIGDLDNDGIEEKLLVLNTDYITDFGRTKKIQIFKKKKSKWKKWKNYNNSISISYADSLKKVEIVNGVLTMIYSVKSNNYNMTFSEKYQLINNKFRLTQFSKTHNSFYNKLKSTLTHYEFDLLTGLIKYKREFGNNETEAESFYKKKVIINLKNRAEKRIKIYSPKYNEELII